MTHFDFKCLTRLCMLKIEYMAHGLESRVPLLDHVNSRIFSHCACRCKIQEWKYEIYVKGGIQGCFAFSTPSEAGKDGLSCAVAAVVFGDPDDMIHDIFRSTKAVNRDFINHNVVLENFGQEKFSRKTWGLLNVELWHQQFHDNAVVFRSMIEQKYGNIG